MRMVAESGGIAQGSEAMHWTFGGMAVMLLIIGYLSCFAASLRRRLRAQAFHQMPVNERLSKLGLGILLLPAVIAVATLSTNVRLLLVLTASGLALVGWTFLPHYLSSKIVSLALVGSGIFTFLLLRAFILSGYSLSRFPSVPGLLRVGAYPQILLLQGLRHDRGWAMADLAGD